MHNSCQSSLLANHMTFDLYTDPLSKANILAEHFSSVFTQEDTSTILELEGNPFPEISPIQVHLDGISQLLHNLKPHKAAGTDNLPLYFLKEVANEISPALTAVFQALFCEHAFLHVRYL